MNRRDFISKLSLFASALLVGLDAFSERARDVNAAAKRPTHPEPVKIPPEPEILGVDVAFRDDFFSNPSPGLQAEYERRFLERQSLKELGFDVKRWQADLLERRKQAITKEIAKNFRIPTVYLRDGHPHTATEIIESRGIPSKEQLADIRLGIKQYTSRSSGHHFPPHCES